MSAEPIRYFHRAKQTVETEQVYGGGWLRWTYGNPLGRLSLELLVKRWLASAYYGWRRNWRAPGRSHSRNGPANGCSSSG